MSDDDLPRSARQQGRTPPEPAFHMKDRALGREDSERSRQIISEPVPEYVFDRIDQDADGAGGMWTEPEEYSGSVGRTMFDTPSSDDMNVTVLLPRESMEALPSQSLVSIQSVPDGREYLAVVVRGPFAEPDGLRGDAPIVVTTTVKGGIFMPKFHGRVEVQLLGERIKGAVVPPRFRPLPNSPVFALDSEQTRDVLKLDGNVPLGLAVGHEDLVVSIPADKKLVLPRHLGILGTTGGGKSTTVSGLVSHFQAEGIATVLIDTEGEYALINEPTDDRNMALALSMRGFERKGVPDTALYHLVGRRTSNPKHPQLTPFTLEFSHLSPYLVTEILDFTEAQHTRYLKAYDVCKRLLRELRISPTVEEYGRFLEPDELEEGYPRMTLAHMLDVTRACAQIVAKEDDEISFSSPDLSARSDQALAIVREVRGLDHVSSWRALQGKLGRLHRLGIFDNKRVRPIDYQRLVEPGRVSIVDLSDTDSPQLNNLVIAELLRGVAKQQNANYRRAEEQGTKPPRTMIVIEEAHEFLSAERIKQMPALSQQVARIARRGRKRWLGLVFVTQLPQHLPDEVLGLVNNYVLHKISDAGVISKLKRSIGDVDEGLWARLPTLAPGQAIVCMTSMARPLLVAIDPTPCKLRMVE
jgi:DNA helicase HerA-like ATPase